MHKGMSPEDFRAIRKEMGLSQLRLGDRLGVSQQIISRAETRGPGRSMAEHMRTLLQVHREYKDNLRRAIAERIRKT